MRHMKSGRKFSRKTKHRRAMLRNIARNLILHERIITTPAKAKDARRLVEKLVTLAREGSLHSRRLALSKLPDKDVVNKLFAHIGPRFAERPGGYTRILHLTKARLGDNAPQVVFEFVEKAPPVTETPEETKK